MGPRQRAGKNVDVPIIFWKTGGRDNKMVKWKTKCERIVWNGTGSEPTSFVIALLLGVTTALNKQRKFFDFGMRYCFCDYLISDLNIHG